MTRMFTRVYGVPPARWGARVATAQWADGIQAWPAQAFCIARCPRWNVRRRPRLSQILDTLESAVFLAVVFGVEDRRRSPDAVDGRKKAPLSLTIVAPFA